MLCTYLYTYLQDNGFSMMFAWDVYAFLMHCDLWVFFHTKRSAALVGCKCQPISADLVTNGCYGAVKRFEQNWKSIWGKSKLSCLEQIQIQN